MTIMHNSAPTILSLIIGLWCLCVCQVFGLRSLPKNEDFEIQKTLKLLTKPGVTTIKTKYGDVYNCVDFHQQHTFDHPALKHRTSEFKMTSSNRSSSESSWATKIWENGKGCPSGTVPVRKYTKSNLIRAKKMAEIHASNLNLTNRLTDPDPKNYRLAVIRNAQPSAYNFSGISMYTSIYNPRVQPTHQFSSSQMKIASGWELLQTGWTVNPAIYDDNRTRLFLFTRVTGLECFNDLCPVFVKDSSTIPLDYAFEEISTPGSKIHDLQFRINSDESGNWFLHVGIGEEESVAIGYWPKQIFTLEGLGKSASMVEWGGETYGQPGYAPLPEMGSGYEATSKFTAYDRNLKVQNEAGQMVDLPGGVAPQVEYPYTMSYLRSNGDYFQDSCFFGGPIHDHVPS